MKKITLAICLFVAITSNAQFPQLFSTTSDTGFVAEAFDSTVIAKQNIAVNINNLKSQNNNTLQILLPGVTGLVTIKKTKQSVNTTLNSFEWYGKIQGSPNSFVLLTSVGSAVAGYMRDGNKIYRLQYRANNVHQVASINNEFAKPDKVMRIVAEAASSYITDSAACCDTTKVVDIMVVYTAEAATIAGGTDGILSQIDLCITLSNQSFENSSINARLNLVHATPIDYTDQNNAETNLSRLTNNPGGMFNTLYALRNTYSADIVVMIVDMMYGYSGIANVMTTNTVAFESSAYAIVSYGESTSNFVFPHEVGHLMGAGHENCGDDWKGLYSYSHGYAGASYNTVMSAVRGRSRVEYWSNPFINYPGDGLPMGVTSAGCPSTNNAATLNGTINTVSQFRCREANLCSKPPCKWFKCWIFWLAVFLASILLIILILFRRRRRRRRV